MSSKEQFKEALKRDKQTFISLNKKLESLIIENDELKRKLTLRDKLIDEQKLRIKLLQIDLKEKRQWWKFWKHKI